MDERLSQMKGPEQGPIAVLDPDGRFGHWITDECDLPAYEYTADQDNDPTAAVFTTQGPSNLHWHQVGNDRLTAIATNCGEVQALESSRGLQRLNYRDRGRLCPGADIAIVLDEEGSWTDLYQPGLVPFSETYANLLLVRSFLGRLGRNHAQPGIDVQWEIQQGQDTLLQG